jgi:uncharacterized membrane protein
MRRPEFESLAPDLVGRAADLPARAIGGGDFEAVLYPNRSLPNAGFIAVMALLICVNFTVGVFSFFLGAWPVIGFCGLDVLLVYIAFRLSYRQGRLREHVRLTEEDLFVSRILPSGHESRWRLQPYWTRVTIDRPVRHESQVRLLTKGETLILGSFLSPRERGEFAAALAAALSRLRRA